MGAIAVKSIPKSKTAPAKAEAIFESTPGLKVTAEQMAEKQRDISVSEFFVKNRHLLGFDNPTRALLTTVKEAVDNSLDACEEAGVLPEVIVRIVPVTNPSTPLGAVSERSESNRVKNATGETPALIPALVIAPASKKEEKTATGVGALPTRFHVIVEDNGPGVVKAQIPNIFGKLLYGSKFHTLKMSRGQQGIGISAAGLYGQLTTGKPIIITSRTAPKKPAHYYEIHLDTSKNQPVISKEEEVTWDKQHGTKVDIELEARYIKGNKSVDDYIRQTALANPHVTLIYEPPIVDEDSGADKNGQVIYARSSKTLPPEAKAIKPHPYGVELGNLIKMLQSSKSRQLKACLQSEFSRVSPKIAREICQKAGVPESSSPSRIARQEAENLYQAINQTKIMAPPTDCLSPIGENQILTALKANVKAAFYTSVTRSPEVYRGNPFVMEVGLAFGVEGYPADELITLHRYANRVPLLYQPGACSITKAVLGTDWKNYGLSQSKGALPVGPMMLIVHMASVWVPFTSEAKEAVAHYPEIIKEIKLALQECGRRLMMFLRKRDRANYDAKRASIFILYAEELSTSLNHLTGCGKEKVKKDLLTMAKKVTKAEEREGS